MKPFQFRFLVSVVLCQLDSDRTGVEGPVVPERSVPDNFHPQDNSVLQSETVKHDENTFGSDSTVLLQELFRLTSLPNLTIRVGIHQG